MQGQVEVIRLMSWLIDGEGGMWQIMTAEGGAFGWKHYWHYTPHPAGPVLQEVSNQSLQDHEASSALCCGQVSASAVTLLEQRD